MDPKVSPDFRQGFQNAWLSPPELLQSSRLAIIGRFDWCRFMTSFSKALFSWGKLSCNQQSDPPRKVQHFWLLTSRTIPKRIFHNQLDLAFGICCSSILWWRNNECNDQDVMVNMFLIFSECKDQGVLVNITLWPLGSYIQCATGI